jgi:separase
MDMAKSSTTLSGRLRVNRILADAAYVCSLLATVTGNYKDAARHVRQCVTLNRRIWAALESKTNVKKAAHTDNSDLDDGSNKVAFDPLSSLRNDKGTPLVMSVTHDALSGPDFWALVPALYRGMMQHSQVFAHQGLLQEAIHIAEQAEKVASAIQSPTLMIDNASWRADCWAQSGRPDKAEPLLETVEQYSTRKSLSIVGYTSAVARAQHWNGQYEQEVASYSTLDRLLQDLTSPDFMNALHTFAPSVDSLTELMSRITIDVGKQQPSKTVATRGGRKPAAKPTPRTTQKAAPKVAPKARSRAQTLEGTKATANMNTQKSKPQPPESRSSAEQCCVLSTFQAEIMHRSVLANILQKDLATAATVLAQLEQLQDGVTPNISHAWATFKLMLAQSFKQIADNIALNTLPDSTIAFPAINLKERRLSEGSVVKRKALASSTTAKGAAKGARAKVQLQENFAETLKNARDRLREAHAASAMNSPNFMFQQISMALGTITVLLSAVSGEEMECSLHPLYTAYMAGMYLRGKSN